MPESPLDVLSRAASMVESNSAHNSSTEMMMDTANNSHNTSSDSDIAQPDSPPQVHATIHCSAVFLPTPSIYIAFSWGNFFLLSFKPSLLLLLPDDLSVSLLLLVHKFIAGKNFDSQFCENFRENIKDILCVFIYDLPTHCTIHILC